MSHLSRPQNWIYELKLELLEGLHILSHQDCVNALAFEPEILKVDGPRLKASFRTLVGRNVFGSREALRDALLKCPSLLACDAEEICIADVTLREVFEEQAGMLFASRPGLLKKANRITLLFDKLYEMFKIGDVSETSFVRLRLKESVMEPTVWSRWYEMLEDGSQVDSWIGELQIEEGRKGKEKTAGGEKIYGRNISDAMSIELGNGEKKKIL